MNATLARTPTSMWMPAWRPMREEDLAAVAAMEAEAHPAPWTLGNFRDALVAGYSATVGDIEDAIVAYGVMMLAPGEAQLLNLTVANALRRQGIGRALLRRFLVDAFRLGAEQCFLEVRVSNVAAIALYSGEGFAPVARRVGYYPVVGGDRREDALVLRRSLRAR